MLRLFSATLLLLLAIIHSRCEIDTNNPAQEKSIKLTHAITAKRFQLGFLEQVSEAIDATAHEALNQLLQQVIPEANSTLHHSEYSNDLEAIKHPATQVERKIVFIKQMLDLKNDHHDNIDEEHFYTLRNVNFLKKLKMHMEDFYEETANALRSLRVYALCKQFQELKQQNDAHRERQREIEKIDAQAPYSRTTKLMPLIEATSAASQTEAVASTTPIVAVTVDRTVFGKNLYERVKELGGEIIDEFLYSIRKMLREVIDDKPEDAPQVAKIRKFIMEIDSILDRKDFFQKRERLYSYLQSNLASDYEQLKQKQEDLAEIFAKLKEKGLNVFVTFLFSNFEFLEHLHTEWNNLLVSILQQQQQSLLENKDGHQIKYDDDTQLLIDVSTSYVSFKEDNENDAKYENYMQKVKELKERSAPEKDIVPIYEILHSASLNVGSITINIIKGKCEDMKM